MNKLYSFIVLLLTKRVQRSTLISEVMFLFLLVVFLSACSTPWVDQTSSTSYQFKVAPTQPTKEILVCDDRTGSVKAAIYDAGLRLVVRNLAGIIHGDQGRITFTLAKIDHHSHLPESTLVTGQIAAVQSSPEQPLLSPFLDPTIKKQIMDQYKNLQDEAEKSLQQAQAQVSRLESEIMRNDSHHIPVDDIGTDIIGCLLKANDLFSKGAGVQRYLLVISDMANNINVSAGVSLLLPGVVAGIVFYCSDSAKVCQNRKLMYQSLLTKAGAQVTFYDVSQVYLLNGIFGN